MSAITGDHMKIDTPNLALALMVAAITTVTLSRPCRCERRAGRAIFGLAPVIIAGSSAEQEPEKGK